MCGIIAYIGEGNAVPVLIKGLKKLEYRGYDSAGICVVENKRLITVKRKGRIEHLEKHPGLKNINSSLGISHTRWATHGEPSEINAHPHLDCKGEIAIVHNGIIENHNSLKKLLEKEGHKIVSDTDSEVIAHLIEKFYSSSLENAVAEALKLIEGAYGLAVIQKDENKIVAARKGSPLILGIGKNEMLVASDIPAVLQYTRKVIYLNDNEIAVLTNNSYSVMKINGEKANKKIHKIKWSIEETEKKGFRHFMLKEIFEQPDSVKNLLRGRMKNNKIKLTLDMDVKKIKRIIITACGTSWHSALIGKHIIEDLTRIPVYVDYASELRYRNPVIKKGDVLIVISQSGETADTLAALKEIKSKKCKCIGIVNVVGSTIAREVDSGIYLHAGPEMGVASTKAFSSQVLALLLFALWIRQEKGYKIDDDLVRELKKIPEKINIIVKKSDRLRELAEKFKNSTNFLYLGRGINFPVALEGALKLKEISYIHAEGYPAAEMKHGPIALIDRNMPVVFLATKNNLSDKILSNMQEVKARKGRIIAVANEKNKEIEKLADYIIIVPETLNILSPILNIIPLQLLAYHIADLKGLNVDKPRNLAKSVTVE
ncbi:glutamine--fructose-6-phosphate transaminase (isomerizing) [Candidatus Woesearchaeota archaeon]|nr:glutamine--fructose-6-phosphate transaminase (isomerizing) [Candidatus Woesearchaeota archaeon]